MKNPFVCSSDWLKESSLEESINFLRSLARVHAQQAGPYAARLQEILEASAWGELVDFPVDYGSGSVTDLYHCRQCLAFFQKLEKLPLQISKEEVAWQKFVAAEEQCGETNRRLRASRRGGIYITPPRVAAIIAIAQRKISEVLGDVPDLRELNCSFGPGASTTVKAKASSARWKLNAQPACSVELVPVIEPVLRMFPHYALAHRPKFGRSPEQRLLEALEDHVDSMIIPVLITPGKLQFVPKNAKTYRSIVVEPVLNGLLQKGIGKYIRGRLRRAGINLRIQSQVNKNLARIGSIDGSLATIDLSSASDTIALEVVEELLPYDWVSFLRNFRTGTVSYKGKSITLEKFSSMGNAFTFELETLIFWAIAWAACAISNCNASRATSFGDDIILPTDAVPALFEGLSWLGFSVNEEKSFWQGPFRESCGGDFYLGVDIRPYYQKDLVSGQTLFALHNYYVRTLQPELACAVREAIHPDLRQIWGPDGYGDGHLIGDWHHAARVTKKIREHGWGGVVFDTLSLKPIKLKKKAQTGDRVLPLYVAYVRTDEDLPDEFSDIPLFWDDDAGFAARPNDHYLVRGHRGYRRQSIYTLTTTVFCRSL